MNTIQSFVSKHRLSVLLFTGILAVYGLSLYKRMAEYSYWMDHPQNYIVDQVIAMSSMDAYYWLAMARELDSGYLEKGKDDPRKAYPDRAPFAIKGKPSLLAELISFVKNVTGVDYYRAGLILVVVLPGLFIFPLFFYFNRLGFGASAVLGGLVGSFGHAYFDRTMMGRLDTDLLNTFFPLAVACFILPMNKERDWRANIGLAVGAGVTMYLYCRWYQMPSFILVYLFIMAVCLLIGRVNWKQTCLLLLVFLLASGPSYVMQSLESLRVFFWAYVSPPPTGLIAWPNILKTVSEAQTLDLATKLNMLHGFWPIVFAGFAGLAYLSIVRFKKMIPVAPLLMLSAWSMVGPARFVMYLGPFIGVGTGVLIELLVRFAGRKLKKQHQPLFSSAASISLMTLLFFSTAGGTSFYLHTAPIISPSVIRAILDIKQLVPKHSAIFSPFWEFSYALMDIGDFATYHDGGLQGGMRTTLASKAMISTRQKEMVSMLSYLEDYGFNRLSSQIRKERLSADRMMNLVFSYPAEFKGENVYVLYLEENIWKFDGMSYFGTWDFNRKESDPMYYVDLQCSPPVNNFMTCHDGTIDLNEGFMSDGRVNIPLRAALFVNNGNVVDQKYYRQNFDADQGYYLQVLMKNQMIHKILVADDRLFPTNFNQQFLLGKYDRRYFEEVYNHFPAARLLRVKKAGEESGATADSAAVAP